MLRDTADFEATVELFHRAAMGQASWEEAMAGMSRAAGGQSCNLVGVERGLLQFLWANDTDPDMWVDLGETLESDELNPRLWVGRRVGAMQRVEGYDFGADAMMRRFPAYAEICRKYDVGFGSLMNLCKTDESFVGMAILRGKRQEHGSAEDGDAISALAPHLLDAIRVRRMIDDQGALLVQGALEAIKAAAFLCDRWGRVRCLTAGAEAMIGPAGFFVLKQGVLACGGDRITDELQRAIRRAARNPLAPVHTMVIATESGGRMLVQIAPLSLMDGSLGFAPRVIVTARGRREPAGAQLVAAVFGLTQAEAEVARALALGAPREAIAAARGVAVDTIRSQLKTIFAKLEVSREAELIARLYEIS